MMMNMLCGVLLLSVIVIIELSERAAYKTKKEMIPVKTKG